MTEHAADNDAADDSREDGRHGRTAAPMGVGDSNPLRVGCLSSGGLASLDDVGPGPAGGRDTLRCELPRLSSGEKGSVGDLRNQLAAVLAAHESYGGGWFCNCTPADEDGAREFVEASWELHLADAVLASDAVAHIRAEAKAEALREAADDYGTPPTGLTSNGHVGWWLRDRADGLDARAAEDSP